MAAKRILGLWLLAVAASGDSVPQTIADEFGAKCLSGSAPSYEISRNESSSKWVLFLEGGGWCYGKDSKSTIDSCAGRGGFKPPTSTGAAFTPDGFSAGHGGSADIGGVMAADPSVNPDFYSWNKVFLHYCDGASFGSGRADAIAVKTHDGKPGSLWMRGRNNFDAVIADLQRNRGFAGANLTEVILSGGSAGGLAVFYNLDHLAAKLNGHATELEYAAHVKQARQQQTRPQARRQTVSSPSPKEVFAGGVRVSGFPDAGFFLDQPGYNSNPPSYDYRDQFRGADPVWNVTGSGGTNKACLRAYSKSGGSNSSSEAWKCLMAPYIAEHVATPLYVMNSMTDAWQMGSILHAPCIPTPSEPCAPEQTRAIQDYQAAFAAAVAGVTRAHAGNGVFADACYVHEQNVNYCSGQGMPNCVGWSPLESGSKKWGYTTSIQSNSGTGRLTPQQAFGAWYKAGGGSGDPAAAADSDAVLVDKEVFPSNPSCKYLGKPAPKPKPTPPPTPPTPPTPPPPPTPCADFSGKWIDNPHWFTPVTFAQHGCEGKMVEPGAAYSVAGDTLTAAKNFHGGLTGKLVKGYASAGGSGGGVGVGYDTIEWANGAKWERNHTTAADL